jgi:hypothetical protein
MTATLAFAVAACSGNSTAGSAPAASSSPPGAGQNAARTPGVSGTAAAVSASSLEVQNPNSGQVTVNFNSSTTFTNAVAGSLQDVTVGACVMVAGNPGGAAGAPVTARSVTITQASGNGCSPMGGGPGGGGPGGGGPGGGGGHGGSQPGGTNRPGPNGTNGGRAIGAVASVTGNTFTVTGNNRSSGATTTTVTVDSSTTYTKEVSADSSALAVGECIAATGTSDSTGAVTAKTIAVSKPGANGTCSAGGRNAGGSGG